MMLFLDSTTPIQTVINSYCIVVPYLQQDAESTESAEFSFENGKPCFHLPFFFGIMNTQVYVLILIDATDWFGFSSY